jgi:hypothetical protein
MSTGLVTKGWKNAPDPSTPVSAEALVDAETRIGEYIDGQVTAERGARETDVTAEETRALTAEALLAPKASPTFTGTPLAPTAAAATNTTQIATTAFVQTAVSGLAPLSSPVFTGNPTAPTQTAGNSSTRLATTAFVAAAVATGAVSVYSGQSMAAGESALEHWATMSTAERSVHLSNTAYGYHALQNLNGSLGTFAVTAETAVGSGTINLTGVEGKVGVALYSGGHTHTPVVVFKKLTAGVTGLKENQAYYIINGTANTFQVAETFSGAAILVAGANVKVDTEVTLLNSTEDNTAIGSQAGLRLTSGGGNTLVGENAGVNLTSGEENVVVGCEALGAQQTVTGITALGFRAAGSNTTGTGIVAVGYTALEQVKTTNELVAVGWRAAQEGSGNSFRSTALGFEAMRKVSSGSSNTVLGALAGKSFTSGAEDTFVGTLAGSSTTTGNENVFVGMKTGFGNTTGGKNTVTGAEAFTANTTGERNTVFGYAAGESVTGSLNVLLGHKAGQTAGAISNKLIITNNATTALIQGVMSETAANLELGFYNVAPTKRAGAIASPAETLAGLKTAVDAIRVALQKIGITE